MGTNKMIAAGALAGLGLLASAPANAEFEASVGAASEYVFRGVASGSPQVWGGVDWSSDYGVYAGTWVSSTSTQGNEEVDYYVGWGNDMFDVGAIYYAYPSQPSQGGSGITEIYGGIGIGHFAGYIWYAPAGVDGPDDDEYAYLDLNLDIPLTQNTSIGAHLGYLEPIGDNANNRDPFPQPGDDPQDADFDLGVSLNVSDFFLALTYLDCSRGGFSTVVGYSWALPIN